MQASALPPVLGDATQLRQIIHNLLRNAEDALEGREDGRILIETSLSGRFARLQISDNGPGISAANVARVFEPFFTTKAKGKGTGLGLSTVYGIVQQHDGWVDVDSQPECGATFSVYLPELAQGGSP